MTNRQHVDKILSKLEKDFGSDEVYDFFSAMYDVAVLGHSSQPGDNPHSLEVGELKSHKLYKLGAQTAERLVRTLGASR
jgi:hypothetical protein